MPAGTAQQSRQHAGAPQAADRDRRPSTVARRRLGDDRVRRRRAALERLGQRDRRRRESRDDPVPSGVLGEPCDPPRRGRRAASDSRPSRVRLVRRRSTMRLPLGLRDQHRVEHRLQLVDLVGGRLHQPADQTISSVPRKPAPTPRGEVRRAGCPTTVCRSRDHVDERPERRAQAFLLDGVDVVVDEPEAVAQRAELAGMCPPMLAADGIGRRVRVRAEQRVDAEESHEPVHGDARRPAGPAGRRGHRARRPGSGRRRGRGCGRRPVLRVGVGPQRRRPSRMRSDLGRGPPGAPVERGLAAGDGAEVGLDGVAAGHEPD